MKKNLNQKFEVSNQVSQTNSKNFKELGICKPLLDNCLQLNYKYTTQIQQEALPYALQQLDLACIACSGAGKTLVFALPILQHLLSEPIQYFALIVEPTRELARQTFEVMQQLGKNLNITFVLIVGGSPIKDQIQQLQNGANIVISTPGRLLDIMHQNNNINFKSLKYLVFDEFDFLYELGFSNELNEIIECIPKKVIKHFNSYKQSSQLEYYLKKYCKIHVMINEQNLRNSLKSQISSKYIYSKTNQKLANFLCLLHELQGNSILLFGQKRDDLKEIQQQVENQFSNTQSFIIGIGSTQFNLKVNNYETKLRITTTNSAEAWQGIFNKIIFYYLPTLEFYLKIVDSYKQYGEITVLILVTVEEQIKMNQFLVNFGEYASQIELKVIDKQRLNEILNQL